jgi:hypothetical protein
MKVKLLKLDHAFLNAHWNLVKTPQTSILTIFKSLTRRISPEKKMVVSMYSRLLRRNLSLTIFALDDGLNLA